MKARLRTCRSVAAATAWSICLSYGAAHGQTPAARVVAPGNDLTFQKEYTSLYRQLHGIAADLLVEELRQRVELVVTRGSSQVGAVSNFRRVRLFESSLLRELQRGLCANAGAKIAPGDASTMVTTVADSVSQAAGAQQLRTEVEDLGRLTALTQRLVEAHTRARLCALRSLEDVE